MSSDNPWRDKEVLREKYWEEGKSCYEVADELGCGYQTVLNWLDRTGLGTRKSNKEKPAYFRTNQGYERVSSKIDGENHEVLIHRLVAFAEGMVSASELFDSGVVIHHKNGIKWDNRPENLEKMSFSDHMRHHMNETRDRDEQGRVV